MNPLRRLVDALASLLPMPESLDDRPPAADVRLDPDALDAYGRAQLAQFGPGQSHGNAAPAPTHYATDTARALRDASDRARQG
jgi:hypothetical protein